MKMLLRTIAWILCIILVILPTLAQERRPPRSPPPPRRPPPPPRRPPSPPPPRRPPSPPPPRRPPSPPPPRPPPPPPPPPRGIQYPKETWTLQGTYPGAYTELIASLRDGVKAGDYCDIPVTTKTPLPAKEFILLEITSLKNNKVTLIFRTMNFYYVGFLDELNTKTRANFIREDFKELKDRNLFDVEITTQLPHGGNYIDLQNVAGVVRRDLKLGVNSLSPLIDTISGSDYDGRDKPDDIGKDLAKFALVAIQMIAEASRFKYIEEQVRDKGTYQGTFYPDSDFISYQNDWGMISTLIYQTTKTDKDEPDCSKKVKVPKYKPEDIKTTMGLLLYNKDGRMSLAYNMIDEYLF